MLITQPPESATAALNTNATFTCRGNGDVLWEINNTQIRTDREVRLFAEVKVFAPLPKGNVSELIVTATPANNDTRAIRCLVEESGSVMQPQDSNIVRLLVFGEYLVSSAITLDKEVSPPPPR